LTTFNYIDSELEIQIARFKERRVQAMTLAGRRAMIKDTAELCTIKKAEIFEEGIRYTVHKDKHPENLRVVLWNGLVVIGEVQS